MQFSIIAAADEQNGIGKENRLPWHLPGDLAHFQKITAAAPRNKQNAVIMGTNTWLSLPKAHSPLPGRINIVLNKNPEYAVPEGVRTATSLNEALHLAEKKEFTVENVFIVGGGMVYAESILHPECERIFLTRVERTFDCDTFFPKIPSTFKIVEASERFEENGIPYRFVVYRKTV